MYTLLPPASKPAFIRDRRADVWLRGLPRARVPVPPVPMPRDPERRRRCGRSLYDFIFTYHGDLFWGPSAFHTEFIDDLQRMIFFREPGVWKIARAAPRGIGKTSLCGAAIEWAALYGHIRFGVIVGSNAEHAEARLATLRTQLWKNELLAEDFPEIVNWVRAFDNDAKRSPPGYPWSNGELKLPNECWLLARGLESRIPGEVRDGARPDLVLIDDPETFDTVESPTETKMIEGRIRHEVCYLHGQGVQGRYVLITTIRKKNSISDRFTNPAIEPEWRGKRYQALVAYPKHDELWGVFGELFTRAATERDTLATPDATAAALAMPPAAFAELTPQYQRALRFYVAHRADMDEGAELLDARRLALHECYHTMYGSERGRDEFLCELQNDPPADDREHLDKRRWTAPFIASHATDYEPLTLPAECPATIVTMGADVHAAIIYYVFRAWAPDGTSWLYESGVAEPVLHARADDSEKSRMRRNMLARLFAESQKGFVCGKRTLGLSLGYVDEGWETNDVRAACHETGGLWRPIKGMPGMRAPRLIVQKDNPFSINIGVYHFKHDLARLLERRRTAERTEPGFFHLYNRPSYQYPHHMCSECWIPKRNRDGTDVEEYEWHTDNRNNHWWDCEVYAAAAAVACGISFVDVTRGVAPAAERSTPAMRFQMDLPRDVRRERF